VPQYPTMKRSLPLLIVLCLVAPLLFAQKGGGGGGGKQNQNQNQNNQNGQATPNPNFINMWRCTLPAGGYAVALRTISSVSTQQYTIDGHTRVTEVDIDTTGCALARFYYIEPNTPNSPIVSGTIDAAQQLLQQGADATGQDVWQKVVKSYPTTTHAKTIEYRIQDVATLTALYNSAVNAWRTTTDTVFTVPGPAPQ
jgi:hypothetical protein